MTLPDDLRRQMHRDAGASLRTFGLLEAAADEIERSSVLTGARLRSGPPPKSPRVQGRSTWRSRSAGFGGTKERTYLKFTDSGAALFARAARLASNIPSILLQAVSASAKDLNGEPMTLTAPVRA